MIYPNTLIESPNGSHWSFDKEKAEGWLKQFPEDKVTGHEWEAYAWPGGYEIHYLTKDGGTLCHQCANANLELTTGDDPQWQIIAAHTHYEGDPLTCDHCNREIQPEYGEDNVEAS